jgi:hypothetical protein
MQGLPTGRLYVSPVTGKRRMAPAVAAPDSKRACGSMSGDNVDHHHSCDDPPMWVLGRYHFDTLPFAHQQRQFARVHGIDDDDYSLDSLPEATLPADRAAINNSEPAPSLQDALVACTLHMVQHMMQDGWNPIGQLHEYFQKRTKQPIHHCFEDVSIPTSVNGALAWNCRFDSPDPIINQQLKGGCDAASLSSCLPLALFQHVMAHSETSANTQWVELRQAMIQFLGGEYFLDLDDEGWAYFSTKKAARKSCAIAVLGAIRDECGLSQLDMWYSTSFAESGGIQTTIPAKLLWMPSRMHAALHCSSAMGGANQWKGPESANTLFMAAQPPTAIRGCQFPSWVQTVYNLGITSVEISYHEYRDANNSGEWRLGQPASLCCQMSVRSPLYVNVISEACTSKQNACESAVRLLQEEFARSDIAKPNANTTSVTRKEEMVKEALLASSENGIQIAYPIPAWAQPQRHAKWLTNSMHLFEITFECGVGHPLDINESGNQTRVGVLLHTDIFPPISMGESMSVDFPLASNDMGQMSSVNNTLIAHARLTKLVTFDHPFQPLALSDGTSIHCLEALQFFNVSLLKWKSYGIGRKQKFEFDVDQSFVGFHGRGYLFVPLLDNTDPVLCPSSLIDFDMVQQEYEGRSRPLVIGTSCTWQLPYFGCINSHSVTMMVLLLAGCFFTMPSSSIETCNGPESVAALFLILLAVLAFSSSWIPSERSLLDAQLINCFVVHRGLLYLPNNKQSSNITAESSFPESDHKATDGSAPLHAFATFKDYYFKR